VPYWHRSRLITLSRDIQLLLELMNWPISA